jgi:hypothetical protein
MEPSVSVPIANPANPAATAAADPALDPLDPSSGFHGLRVRPPCQRSPYASAPTLVLPSSTAPARRSASATNESRSGTRPRCVSAPQLVSTPAVSRMSLRPYGIPCSGPSHSPRPSMASSASASASAGAARTVAKQSSAGFRRSMRSR